MRVPDRFWFVLGLLCAATMVGLVGCGKSKPSAYGIVSVDGVLLPAGSIRFVPIAETPGGDTGASISEGKYEIEDGLNEGEYRIEIQGTRRHESIKVRLPFPGAPLLHDEVQVVPKEYNENSTLTRMVAAGKNPFDFKLKGMEGK